MDIEVYDFESFKTVADSIRENANTEAKLSFPNDFRKLLNSCKDRLVKRWAIKSYSSDKVIKIPPYAFYQGIIEEANFPNVKEIGKRSFFNAESLTNINFQNVEKIGAYAFNACPLTELIFPKVKEIEDYAFNDHGDRITKIVLDSIEKIGSYVLSGIPVPETIFSKLISSGGHNFASNNNIINVNAPLLETIGHSDFYNCTNLTTFNAPKILTINNYAFQGCSSLKEIDCPECISLGTGYNNFYNCSSLEKVNLPKVKEIASVEVGNRHGTFQGCVKLKEVNAPLTEKIGQEVFRDCVSLESINFPNLNTGISSYSFINCQNLETFNAPKTNGYRYQTFMDCYSLRNLDFSSYVGYISSLSFQRCYNLRSLTFKNRVPIIAREFIYARNLCNLVLNDTEKLVALENTSAFNETAFQKGEGTIFVPDNFIEDYRIATNWSVFANQFKPLSQYAPCTGLSLSTTELNLIGKAPYTLTLTTTPSVTTDPISWRSKDQTVAIVENGVIKPKSNGTTIITAYCGNQLVRCTVNVNGIENNTYEDILYRLPKGQTFQRWNSLEYPETYIDTGISIANQDVNSTIMGEITCNPHNNSWGTIFDCQQDANPAIGFKLIILNQNNDDNLHLYAYGKSVKINISCWKDAPNIKFVLTHEANTNKVTFKYLFNGSVTEISITGSVAFQPYSNTLTLAARKKNDGNFDRNWFGTCHDFIILNRIATDEEIATYLS